MPYTVSRPGGANQHQFEAYVRLLKKWGVDGADVPRTPEPGTAHRWLYVWDQRDEAERFARELRARSGDDAWDVVALDRDAVDTGPLGPIDIYVARQSDGWVYALHPFSEELVRARFPQSRQRESVFIGADIHDEESPGASDWDHVALILTGLNSSQLEALGGYRIYDPDTQSYLYEPTVGV